MGIQWQLIAPVILLQLILVVIALVSLAKAEAETIRGSKLLWVIIILFGNILGSIVYFVAGRRD
ncbi:MULTISPECIES: PLDc N-terminal domain-containing protein [unclassified Paenibacillus]|uniref:PLDc N-terminal domain-containing protein n=1 Tax=unclassified Paenibacillus TaxID=185978 RepID=UPI0008397FEF|nr:MULTISPECIES: PLDc N-terminal domain-containing protein [unclassified Paenibacillus]NWL89146.1 transcriptional regulator [Paenibacillus sp. 79R4]